MSLRPVSRLILCVALFLVMGVGCKGLTQEEVAAVQPVTLNYWTVFNDVSQLQAFADAYKRVRPFVTINIRQVRYDEFDNLLVNALADDVAPDIISIHNRWVRKYQPRLDPMPPSVRVANYQIKGKYAKEPVVTFENRSLPSQVAIRNSYVSTIAEDAIVNGEVYGLPLAMDSLALYYNKAVLDRAGIPVPPSTWEQLQEAVIAATRFDADGRIIQSGIAMGTGENIDNAPDILALLMMQKGLDVMRGQTVTFANDLKRLGDSHPTFEALRFYTDFARPTKEVYSWNDTFSNALDEFVRGKSAFYLGFSFDHDRIKSRAPQMRLGVVPVPQLDEGEPTNVANYWLESVVAKSTHKQLAWDFVRFMTTPENVKVYTDAVRQPSPIRSHIQEQSQDETLGPFADAALTAKNWYRGRNIDVANQALRDFIDGYIAPLPEKESQVKRDSNLLTNAARRVQQSL